MLITNLHNETVMLLPRDDGVPGYVLRSVVHAHHARYEDPHTVSDFTCSRETLGELIIKLATDAGFKCELGELHPEAAREEAFRRQLNVDRMFRRPANVDVLMREVS